MQRVGRRHFELGYLHVVGLGVFVLRMHEKASDADLVGNVEDPLHRIAYQETADALSLVAFIDSQSSKHKDRDIVPGNHLACPFRGVFEGNASRRQSVVPQNCVAEVCEDIATRHP